MDGFSFLSATAHVTKALISLLLGGHDSFFVCLLQKRLKQLSVAECLHHVDFVIEANRRFLLASESSEADSCSGRVGGEEEYLDGWEVVEAKWLKIKFSASMFSKQFKLLSFFLLKIIQRWEK